MTVQELEEIVAGLITRMGEKRALGHLKSVAQASYTSRACNRREVLGPLRERFRRVFQPGGGMKPTTRARGIAKILFETKVELTIGNRCEPWLDLAADARVVVAMGKYPVPHPTAPQGLQLDMASVRDIEAYSVIADLMWSHVGLRPRVELRHYQTDLPKSEATKEFNQLCNKNPDLILVLGSPLSQPLADIVAERILTDDDGRVRVPPAKCVWSFDSNEVRPDSLLSVKYDKRAKEGIRLDESVDFPTRFFPRVSDPEVKRGAESQVFADSGLFMLDTRKKPYLCLLAGHSGYSTLACAYALFQEELLHQLMGLSRSDGAHPAVLGPNRVFDVITVQRKSKGGGMAYRFSDTAAKDPEFNLAKATT